MLFSHWNADLRRLSENKMTLQAFLNANEKKTLFYSTPFFEDANRQHPQVLQTKDSDTVFFPVFTSLPDLQAHLKRLGCTGAVIVRGNLKKALDSMDSHPLIRECGVVIDPFSEFSVGIPPKMRVQPKCLR